MYKIGITGSIGTGKTTVANLFSLFNISIFDSDREIKKILEKKNVKQKIKKIWPLTVRKDTIDKLKLRNIIFFNKNEKKKLENLLYPHLEDELNKFEIKNCKKKILVYDVPLIYETNSQSKYNLILLTHCDKELQRKRVVARDKISNLLFEKIVESQLSFNYKIKFNPLLINTNNAKLVLLLKVFLIIIKTLLILKLKK